MSTNICESLLRYFSLITPGEIIFSHIKKKDNKKKSSPRDKNMKRLSKYQFFQYNIEFFY